jgi:hypothetical protein
VAGAMNKEDYLQAIKGAGFKKVEVVNETNYPLDLFENDPVAGGIMEELKITPEQANDISASIASVKVQGLKPI